jgi:hypothetical protein
MFLCPIMAISPNAISFLLPHNKHSSNAKHACNSGINKHGANIQIQIESGGGGSLR